MRAHSTQPAVTRRGDLTMVGNKKAIVWKLDGTPFWMKERLDRLAADGEQAAFCFESDMDTDGEYKPEALVVTEQRVLVISPDAEGPVREACQAGASPNRTLVRRATASVNRNTRPSIARVAAAGRETEGKIKGKAFTNPEPSVTPNAPPRPARSALSVRSWRTRRVRPAPRDERRAISRLRVLDRARSKLDTLTQAIKKRKPTAPNKTTRLTRS